MNTRILTSMLTIVAVVAAVSAATYAFFSDTQTSSNNTFTAGTLDLYLLDGADDAGDNETGTFVVSNASPGSSGFAGTLMVRNVGSINGFFDINAVSVANTEGTNPESETGDTNDPGELGSKVSVTAWVDADCDGTNNAGTEPAFISNVLLNILAGSYDLDAPLAAGTDRCISMTWLWTSTITDNEAQGDVATLSFNVDLDQTAD